MSAIEHIKHDEGFSATEYICPAGFPSIGYGTKLPLSGFERDMINYKGEVTEAQATKLLKYRLDKFTDQLGKAKPVFYTLPEGKKDVLMNMAYQMGVTGVSNFNNMWAAIEERNFCEAALHMLDSIWYREQTPKRAFRLAMKMKG